MIVSLFPFRPWRRGALAALFFVALAASAATPSGEPIKLGHFGSLTGKDAAFGVATRKGILLAVEELNANGGILGRPVEYLVEDIQSKQGESATAVKKLISRDKVVAILGANASANSLEAAPICQRAKIPMMAISSTAPRVTEIGDYIFRICFIDPFQGAVLAKFSHDSLQAKRLALLTSINSPYSVGLSNVLRERFTALGGEVVAEQKFAEGDKDFRAQLTAIRAAKPDVIAATGFYTEAALISIQARSLGLDIPIIGGDGWEAPQLVELGGKAVENTYYSTYFSAENTAPPPPPPLEQRDPGSRVRPRLRRRVSDRRRDRKNRHDRRPQTPRRHRRHQRFPRRYRPHHHRREAQLRKSRRHAHRQKRPHRVPRSRHAVTAAQSLELRAQRQTYVQIREARRLAKINRLRRLGLHGNQHFST